MTSSPSLVERLKALKSVLPAGMAHLTVDEAVGDIERLEGELAERVREVGTLNVALRDSRSLLQEAEGALDGADGLIASAMIFGAADKAVSYEKAKEDILEWRRKARSTLLKIKGKENG